MSDRAAFVIKTRAVYGGVFHACDGDEHRLGAFEDCNELILVCPGCCRRWRLREEFSEYSDYSMPPWHQKDPDHGDDKTEPS